MHALGHVRFDPPEVLNNMLDAAVPFALQIPLIKC